MASHGQSPLCTRCASIEFSEYVWRDKIQVKDDTWTYRVEKQDHLLGRLADLEATASSCKLCEVITQHARDGDVHLTDAIRFSGVTFCTTEGEPSRTCSRLRIDVRGEDSGTAGDLLELQATVSLDDDDQGAGYSPQLLSVFSGRRVGPFVDLNLLRNWYNASMAKASPSKALKELYVIDTKAMCVVPLPTQRGYLALSYTWGKIEVCKHLKSNSDQLRQPDSLRTLAIPATIRDAITVAYELGERYLWVDALCIVQDNDRHREMQLKQMGDVYANSSLTLIAASGTDADAGLPGIGTGRVLNQHLIRVNDLSMMVVLDPRFNLKVDDYNVPDTHWVARAWTMQEHLFSRRYMVFTQRQVYWYGLHEPLYLEETVLEGMKLDDVPRVPIRSWAVRAQLLKESDNANECWDKYRDSVEAYSRRSLTFQSDKLNAFAAFAAHFSAHTSLGEIIWGLPEGSISKALTWTLESGSRHKASHKTLTKHDRVIDIPIPSWSWMAWNTDRTEHQWIEFPYFDKDLVPDVYFHRVGKGGELVVVKEVLAHAADTMPAGTLSAYWKGPSQMGTDVYARAGSSFQDTGKLRFWTSIASVSIRRREGHMKTRSRSVVHYNVLQDMMGLVPYENNLIRVTMGCTSHLRGCGRPSIYPPASALDAWDEILNLDLLVIAHDPDNPVVLHVLVVEWENGVAYRLGSGRVDEALWISWRREWRVVTLG